MGPRGWYIIRRSLYSLPILLGVCLVIFILFHLVIGDPTPILLGKHASAEQVKELRSELGLDRSLLSQYLQVVTSVFTLDFGRSWSTHQEVSSMILQGLGPTLCLSLPATIFSLLISLGISLLVAFFRGRFVDRFFVFLTVGMMSLSSLAYILFFQWFFAYTLGWFEISGFERGFPHFIPYVLLPIIIWALLSLGPDVRFYRTVLLDEIYQDYVRSARAKGLSEARIMIKHVLKNALIPITTYVMAQLPYLILGALLLETFFGIPGLGKLVYDALNSGDFPVLKAIMSITALGVILVNLTTDILYTLLDPRVKLA